MTVFLTGALVSGSSIMAIGAQNSFVLKQGVLKNNIFWVCLTCFICDSALIALGVVGLNTLISGNILLSVSLAVAGCLFLAVYSIRAFISAVRGTSAMALHRGSSPRRVPATILSTLAITLLNPHVYLDTLVVVGGVSGTLDADQRIPFLLGALSASFIWFFGLGYGARLLTPIFAKPGAWQVLDVLIGCIMLWIASKLLMYSFMALS